MQSKWVSPPKWRRALPRVCLGALLLAAVPAGLRGQSILPDTVGGDTIRPIPLPPLQVRILRSPMGMDEVPLSISVLGRRELLRGRSGSSLEEALQGLPGLQIQNRYNFSTGEKIILRGLGARTQFGVRGIRVLIDGVPATLPDGQSTLDHLDLFSLGSVELLRGPGATLYGNGAGGVIRFTSRPPPGGPGGPEALLLFGSHGLQRISTLFSGEVAGTGLLLSVGRFSFDGFRSDPVSGGGSYGAARRWNGNGQLSRRLAGGELTLTLTALDQDSENPGSLSRELLQEDPFQAYAFNVRQGTGEEVQQGTLGLSWSRAWQDITLDLGAHGIRRELWNPIPPAIIDLSRNAGGARTEIRGRWEREASGNRNLNLEWSVGFESEGQWDRRKNLENDGGRAGELTLDQDETVSARSVFGNTRLGLGPSLSILAGLRYDGISFDAKDHLVSETDSDGSGTRFMDALSPSVGIRVAPTGWLSLRGSISTFFQTPTTSELANQPSGAGGFNPGLDPQRGRSIEVGARVGARGRLQVEGTLFSTLISKELVPFELPETPGRVFFRNSGKSAHEGVEVAASGDLSHGFSFRGAYTHTNSRFREFFLDGEDLEGKRIPGVAPHRLDGILHWETLSPPGAPGAFLELRGLYQGRIPVDDGNSDSASPYALWEIRWGIEGIRIARVDWTLFGGITNLLDRSYTSSVSVNAFGGRYFEPGPGRSVYVGIRAPSFKP